MRAFTKLFALLAIATLSTGCFGFDWDSLFEDSYEYDDGDYAGNLQTQRASLSGAIADVSVSHAATSVDSWGDEYGSDVTVTVDTGAGAAMTVVEIDGDPHLPEVRPGDRVTVYDSRGGIGAAHDVDVRVLGCSGPEVGYWDYDGYADHVVVHVERYYDNPRIIRYDYTATFSDYGETSRIDGSFEVVTPR